MRKLFAHVRHRVHPEPDTEPDFALQRNAMVDNQLIARKISDPRVIKAMRTVPRHAFVPEVLQSSAYEDRPLDIGHGQTISQPYIVAFMTQLLTLQPTDRVLEIGTGSGYQASVLASLSHYVVSIERIEAIGLAAAQRLKALGCENVEIHISDGTLGWPDAAPYDAIIVTAGGPALPRALVDQLAEGGRLVCPIGPREMQRLIRIQRDENGYRREESIACVFVPLIGDQGWSL